MLLIAPSLGQALRVFCPRVDGTLYSKFNIVLLKYVILISLYECVSRRWKLFFAMLWLVYFTDCYVNCGFKFHHISFYLRCVCGHSLQQAGTTDSASTKMNNSQDYWLWLSHFFFHMRVWPRTPRCDLLPAHNHSRWAHNSQNLPKPPISLGSLS